MEEKEIWESPKLEELGDAKENIKNISVVGSGDTEYSILDPS